MYRYGNMSINCFTVVVSRYLLRCMTGNARKVTDVVLLLLKKKRQWQ